MLDAHLFYQTATTNTIPLEFNPPSEKIAAILSMQQFQGKPGEVGLLHDDKGRCCKVYVGAGDKKDPFILASAMKRLPKGHYVLTEEVSHATCLAWALAQYQFDRYKKTSLEPRVLTVTQQQLDTLCIEANAIFLIRDLINTPTNDMGPEHLAAVIQTIAKSQGATFKQWVGDELLKHHFPAIHAVGRASSSAPRLLSLTWGNPKHPKITLVGKGVCFDSGGLDIKSSSNMRLMKKDMGGAAQAIGLAQLLMEKKLPIYLELYVPAVENAVGGNAYRPGDVLTMRNGLTVEIDNTDAEGRLIVADALTKASENHPELLIDFTTLTGAARIAVGTEISAFFTNNDALADALMQSGQKTYDPLWRLPLFAGYNSMLDSTIADLVNSSPSSYAGAIIAALFLQHFIPENMSWVHFDVMAWNVKSSAHKPEGGEAMGMLAMADYLTQRYPVI